MKRKLLAIILAALAFCMLGGFTLGGSNDPEHPGPDVPGLFAAGDRKALKEIYADLHERGVITAQEYELLEQYDFELPESEQRPLDGFGVGGVSAKTPLPAEAGGPPHGGNHPPVGPLTLRGGITVGESERIPLDSFVIGEITTGALGDLTW